MELKFLCLRTSECALKDELLKFYCFDSPEHLQKGFNWWRDFYNFERPHHALDLGVPCRRYERSPKPYPEVLPDIEYDSSMEVRKVNTKGSFSWQGTRLCVGEAFAGDPVGIKESDREGFLDVYYCHQKVLLIDYKGVVS